MSSILFALYAIALIAIVMVANKAARRKAAIVAKRALRVQTKAVSYAQYPDGHIWFWLPSHQQGVRRVTKRVRS